MMDPRIFAIPDIHGHAKGEHKLFADERPIPYTARIIFLWFYHAAKRRSPRFVMISDHINYLTFEDPAAVSLVRRALKLAFAGDLYGAAETASVDIAHAAVVSEAMRAGMRFSIGAEVDNDPRSRPDAQNVVDAMKPDGLIRSVHFLQMEHPDTGEEWFWPFDNPEFIKFYDIVGLEQTWERYTQAVVEAVNTLPGHILGHLHVPGKFGHWPEPAQLEGYEDRILDACTERGMAIEINTRVFYRSHDPAVHQFHIETYRRLLRKAKERDLQIAVGSDAHSPRDQGRGIDVVLPLLDEAEINEIVFPINGSLARVALRVDRISKPRPAPAPKPVVEPAAETASAEPAPELAAPVVEAEEAPTVEAVEPMAADDAIAPESEEPQSAEPEPLASRAPDAADVVDTSTEAPPVKAAAKRKETVAKSAPVVKLHAEPPARPAKKPSAAPKVDDDDVKAKPVKAPVHSTTAKAAATKTASNPKAKPAVAKSTSAAKTSTSKTAPAKTAAAKTVAAKTASKKPAAPAKRAAASAGSARKPAAAVATKSKAPAKKAPAAKTPTSKTAAKAGAAAKPSAKKSSGTPKGRR